MNCETFDNHLMDELYGELDEVTSAAMAKHAASCTASPSCGSKLAGLRSTREVLPQVIPYAEPPDYLEDRILAATRDARPVVPMRRKISGAVSWAGAWAMRPQTAMAAVFLLMIGSSLAFLRTHRSKSESSKAVAVSELGTPEMSATVDSNGAQAMGGKLSAMNGGSASAAADPSEPPTATAPAAVAAAPAAPPPPGVPMSSALALGSSDEAPRAMARAAPVAKSAAAPSSEKDDYLKEGKGRGSSEGALASSDIPARHKSLDRANDGPAVSAPGDANSAAASGAAGGASADDSYASGQRAYAARRFDEARIDFDAAASGNVAAALWAARSVREGSGCAAAVSRFDDVSSRAPSSAVGFDARLEGGRCYRALGQVDTARARLLPLLTVPSHAKRAQAELAAMAPPSATGPATPNAAPPAAAATGARAF